MLAWAAPLATDAPESYLKDCPVTLGQAATEPVDSHSSLCDVTDEPVILAAIGSIVVPRLMFFFLSAQPRAWAWSFTPPVRPPNSSSSI